ncbi:MAG: hypothetical protein ABR596_02640 [Halarsenatibacteraceae bacterium]
MLKPGDHELLDLYKDQGAYQLYNQLRKLCPGFIDGIDDSYLATYITILINIKHIQEQINQATDPERIKILKEVLEDYQENKREYAAGLGLTPESYKYITDHLKS